MSRKRRNRISNRRMANAIVRKMKRIDNNKEQETINYDKLADAIVKAQKKANDEAKLEEEKEQEKLQAEWERILEYRDEPKGLKKIGNTLKVFGNILFFKKENVLTLAANNALLKLVITIFYYAFELLMYACVIAAIVLSIFLFIKKLIAVSVISIVIGLFIFAIARIVRMARFEIDIINEKSYLATLFAAVMSFIAVIVSAIAIVVSIIIKE